MPEQEEFYDAIYNDPEMSATAKALHLHACAADFMARMRLCQRIMSGEINAQDLSAFLEERDRLFRVVRDAVGVKG